MIEADTEFEIGIVGVWVPGRFSLEYAATSDEIIWLQFHASNGDFCGIVPGMRARVQVIMTEEYGGLGELDNKFHYNDQRRGIE